MHRIPKIFSHSSDGSKSGLDSSFGGSRHVPKPRPRLDRRNAAKNINYEVYDYSPSSSSASSSYSSEESLRTRSLDLYGDKTSFRIEGIDGEVEIMCRTLGFAGIDDFTIPAEEYEAMKVRCLSAPLVFNKIKEPVVSKKIEVNYNNAVEFSGEGGVGIDDLNDREIVSNDNYVGVSDDIIGELSELSGKQCEESPNYNNAVEFSGEGGVGIVDLNNREIVSNDNYVGVSDDIFGELSELSGKQCEESPNYNNAVEFSGEGGVGLVDLYDREIVSNDNYVGFSDDSIGEFSELSGKQCEESPSLGFSSGNVYKCRPDNLGSRAYELLNRLGDKLGVGDVTLSDKAIDTLHEFHETSIDGVRPPVLTPPPLVSLPVIHKECSTWDILKAFAPDSGMNISTYERGLCLDEDEDEDEEGTEEGGQKRIEVEEDKRRRIMTREENSELSELCSFTTIINDDDSWSSMTEPTPSISAVGRLKRNIVDWQKGELLGRGSFGAVYEAIDNVDGHFFAVKEVSLLDQDNEGKQCIIQLQQEIALVSQFEHENIVQYYGTMKDESHLYIFLQLVTKGSLLSLYQKYKLQDSQVSSYTRQILHGLKYLHDRKVIHRDIKCANILVDTLGSVKLADFGLAKTIKLNDVKSCKGTAFWMAPEVVRSLGYGLAADIWSLGCTVLEMLTRRFPYYNLECMPALYKIGRGERPPIPDSLSCDSRDFILQCLQVEPSLRPTAAQLLDHPFVKR